MGQKRAYSFACLAATVHAQYIVEEVADEGLEGGVPLLQTLLDAVGEME